MMSKNFVLGENVTSTKFSRVLDGVFEANSNGNFSFRIMKYWFDLKCMSTYTHTYIYMCLSPFIIHKCMCLHVYIGTNAEQHLSSANQNRRGKRELVGESITKSSTHEKLIIALFMIENFPNFSHWNFFKKIFQLDV